MLRTALPSTAAVLAFAVCSLALACGQTCKCEGDVCMNCLGTTRSVPPADGGDQTAIDATNDSTVLDAITADAPGSADVDSAFAYADAPSGDDGADVEDTVSCTQSIDAYCADGGPPDFCQGKCVPDWSTAQGASQWCPSYARAYPQCDGFNLIVVRCRDTSTLYYYDVASSKLVRIELRNASLVGNHCIAGQSGQSVPLLISSGGQPDCSDGAAVAPICASDASGD